MAGVLFFLCLWGLYGTAQGWYLDRSCSKPKRTQESCDDTEYMPDVSQLVTDVMDGALEMGHIALQTLEALKRGKGITADIELLDYMFGFAVKGKTPRPSGYLDRVISVYEQILDFDKNGDGRPLSMPSGQPPIDDVVVFCDYTRYMEDQDCFGNAQDGWACDTVMGIEVKMDSVWHSCKTAQPDGGNPYGFTINSFGQPASTIQLCQWMLEEYYYANYVFWGEAARDGRLASAHQSSNTTPAMDLASVYDKQVLHELTHAVREHETYDVDGDGSYDWKNCEKLSANSKDLDNLGDTSLASYRNADNYALFALGACLTLPPRRLNIPPHRIHRDGSVSLAGGISSKRKRAVGATSRD